MTEYDYSPEGYQNHLKTQARIAKWVDNTKRHAAEFRHPFDSDSSSSSATDSERSRRDHLVTPGQSISQYSPPKPPHQAYYPRPPYPHQPPPPMYRRHSSHQSHSSHSSHSHSHRSLSPGYPALPGPTPFKYPQPTPVGFAPSRQPPYIIIPPPRRRVPVLSPPPMLPQSSNPFPQSLQNPYPYPHVAPAQPYPLLPPQYYPQQQQPLPTGTVARNNSAPLKRSGTKGFSYLPRY